MAKNMLLMSTFFIAFVVTFAKGNKPNIVFLLTDDQDVKLGGQTPMSKTKSLIGDKGIIFENMYVSAPLCCPSRSSILTGKYVHSNGAVNNSLVGNCSSPTWQQTQEVKAFPTYLKEQGYTTFFAGKYLNQYGTPNAGGVKHIPPGWDWWMGLVGNSKYYNYHLSVNGTLEVHKNDPKTDYLTDVINRRATSFLDLQNSDSGPFFMMLSTPACHGPFTPAPKYKNNFPNQTAPHDGSYNKHGYDKHWLIQQAITPLPNDTVTTEDNIFRNRWRTLLSVDDMMENVVNILQKKNLLDNTYIVFSSDNGFHLGQFSMPSDKRQLYEFDVRVPLMIRGPNVSPGRLIKEQVMNIDLAPTFLDMAGLSSTPEQMDGLSLSPFFSASSNKTWGRSTILIEHQGEFHENTPGCPQFREQNMSNCNNHCVCEDSWNNTYSCVIRREPSISPSQPGRRIKYCLLKDNENFQEMYDLDGDQNEFKNLATTLPQNEKKDHETSQKKESRCVQNISEMALNNTSNGEVTVDNLLTYSSISGDATSCDEQFTRLKNYVNKGCEPYRSQLQPLLYPLFVHLYLDQLCNGHKTPAHRFYSKHVKLFENEKTCTQTLESIHKLVTRTDVLGCLEATDFRENKFKIKLSEEALEYLLRHLKHEDNSTIYQIFNQQIKVENTESAENETKRKLDLSEGSGLVKEESLEIKEDPEHLEALSALQLSIRQVREGPPCLPSICFYTFINAYQGLCTVDISPDKTLLSAGFEDASIKIWSTTPSLLQSTPQSVDPCKLYIAADYWNVDLTEESKPRYTETVTLRAHSGSVYKTCFSSDSKYLLSASEDTTVRLWDMSTHSNRVCYKGHSAPVWDLDVGSVGGFFASCSQDRTAKLWVSDRIYPVRTFAGHNLDVDCVKFHPNCNYLATGSSDRSVRLWTLQDGKSVRLMHGHRGTIMSLAFSPNGNFLASAGEDKRIRVWDLSSGQLYKELKGHTDTVHSLSFSRDNNLLASGGLDCSIKVWDIRKGVASSSSHSDGISSPELLGSFSSKSAVVTYLNYSEYNVLRGAGSV
ncbi:uncharacterized protein LOC111119188 [Crassostrea virginica]